MLRDGLSDGIRVESRLIKECVWQLKADRSVKGLNLIMGKNQEVAEEYTKNINVRKTKFLLNSLHFYLEGRKLILKKQLTYFGSPIIQDCYWEKEIRSCSCKKGVHRTQWAEIIRVASHKRTWLLKRLHNRKEWPKHGQQRVHSLNC